MDFWQRLGMPLGPGTRIALVEVHGAIMQGARVAETVRLLRGLEENARIRAVVLDVDSPGGSAALSDLLHRAVLRLGRSKPVVAHVRSQALSGGYIVACAARRIVAPPTALVGSIGVIIARPVVRDLLERMGVKMFVSRVGEHKDMMQPWREPTPEEAEKIAALRDEYYQWFISLVAERRGLPEETVRSYATGEFFTAAKARQLGLVDELGDLETALDMASEMGRAPRQVVYVRPRRALLERLMAPVGRSLAEALVRELDARLGLQVLYR
ncbi:MAG: signal peptide peptidase SppA [Dehalococcoidia bacterium]|jgi:protease-4|nr:signal peptide peptidase SppA [Dehalococcoidia bacterium]MDW8009294.1 signal peptide peptidase SppA [Chloroflexota bacterium]